MNREKIEKLEEEVRDLFYNPTQLKTGMNLAQTKERYVDFWNVHLKRVISISKQLAEKYKADLEVVWTGAILHDIAQAFEKEPHDKLGKDIAYEMTIKKGFDQEFAEKIKNIVLKHRCKEYMPETLEEKIIASADAIAHLTSPTYIWLMKIMDTDFKDGLKFISEKLDRDFHKKIFFDEEKEEMKKYYEVSHGWFDYE